MSSIVLVTAPTQTPVTLDDVKARLRITHNEEDALLTQYLKAAVEFCQEYQWAQYCTATYAERWDCFPAEIRLQRNPLIAVTSLTYVDTSGTTQTLTENTDFVVDKYSIPARIVPQYSHWWPATRGFINSVTLTYTAGYGSPSSVPDDVKQAIVLKAAQQYGDCDTSKTVEDVVCCLLSKKSYRVFY